MRASAIPSLVLSHASSWGGASAMMAANSYTLIREGHGTSSPQRERADLMFLRSNCARSIPREEQSAGIDNGRHGAVPCAHFWTAPLPTPRPIDTLGDIHYM